MKWADKAKQGLIRAIDTNEHRIRVYQFRLAISRQDDQRLTWEEVQAVKESIWPGTVCVEVYPAAADVVNLRHTRHLWSSASITNAVRETCIHPEFEVSPHLQDKP